MSDSFEIVAVDDLDCRLEPKAWEFAVVRAAEIEAHWTRLTAARPALWNGQVLLQYHGELGIDGGRRTYRSRYFQTDYKSFIAWRDFGRPGSGMRNCFSMAALAGADGAFVAGEMADHTANAGKVYFAAGTPEPADLRGDIVDLDASVRRELEEETGVRPEDVRFEPGWTVVMGRHQVACMKAARSRLDADELAARIGRFLASQTQPELSRVYVLRTMADLANLDAPAFMPAYLEWALRKPQAG